MAGSAIIGALRVVLGADTAALEKGLSSAETRLASFGGVVGKAGGAAAAAFIAVGATVAMAVKGVINNADELGKAAQKFGFAGDEGVKDLSRLKYAADLSGVSFESLGTSSGKLARNMSAVAGGATNDAAQAFKALGISVTNSDGTLKSSTQVMTEVAGKFGGMEDGAGKTALAMAIFGKSGADMIPMLNSGADGLRAMMQEADELGIVIDSKTAKSAEAFNDNLTRLGRVKDGIITQVAARMLPAFENLSNVFVAAAKNSSLMDIAAKVLTVTLQGLVSGLVVGGAVLKVFGESLAAIASSAVSAAKGNFAEAWDRLKTGVSDVKSTVEGTASALSTIWVGPADANAAAAPELAKKIAAPIIKSAEKAVDAAKAMDGFFTSTAKNIAKLEADTATTGMAAGAKEKLRIQTEALAIAQSKNITLTAEQVAKVNQLAAATELATLKNQGAQLVQQNLAPHEAFRQEIENNRLALLAKGATAEEVGRVMQGTAEKYGNTWGQVGQSVAGSFQQIGQAFAKESRSMAIVAKAAGIVQATISMFTGAAKALELPFPANLGAWATVLATGAGAVANIRSINAGGFATGGMIRVPGGMGGGDRVRAMVDLEPGEQLDVWRPDQGGGDPRRGGGASNVNISVVGKLFSRDTVEELIEGINNAIGDGVKIRLQ